MVEEVNRDGEWNKAVKRYEEIAKLKSYQKICAAMLRAIDLLRNEHALNHLTPRVSHDVLVLIVKEGQRQIDIVWQDDEYEVRFAEWKPVARAFDRRTVPIELLDVTVVEYARNLEQHLATSIDCSRGRR